MDSPQHVRRPERHRYDLDVPGEFMDRLHDVSCRR